MYIPHCVYLCSLCLCLICLIIITIYLMSFFSNFFSIFQKTYSTEYWTFFTFRVRNVLQHFAIWYFSCLVRLVPLKCFESINFLKLSAQKFSMNKPGVSLPPNHRTEITYANFLWLVGIYFSFLLTINLVNYVSVVNICDTRICDIPKR